MDVQAHAVERLKPEDLGTIYVRSKTIGIMIPLSRRITTGEVAGTEITVR